MSYKAILFSLDGEWTTDFKAKTIRDVWDLVNDRGSRWFFYPIVGIIKDNGATNKNQRVIEMCNGFTHLEGKTIKTISNWIRDHPESEAIINA